MSEYFPKPKSSEGELKVELDLYHYPTKEDLKNAAKTKHSFTSQIIY